MTTSAADRSRGAGRYAPDRSAWYDERRGRWHPVLPEQESVQVELEDAGNRAWWARVLATLGTQNGQQYLRFVARAPGSGGTGRPVESSSTFASPRWVHDVPPEPEWAPGMSESLAELRRRLEDAGWVVEGRGETPWSYRYARPRVDWSRELQGPGGPEAGDEDPHRP